MFAQILLSVFVWHLQSLTRLILASLDPKIGPSFRLVGLGIPPLALPICLWLKHKADVVAGPQHNGLYDVLPISLLLYSLPLTLL